MRRVALPLLLALACAGCDGSGDAPGPFDGVWQFQSPDALFLVIDPEAFTYHDFQNDPVDRGPACFRVQRYRIAQRTGHTYTLHDSNGTSEVTLRLSGAVLEIRTGAEVLQRYARAARSAASLTPPC